MKNLPPFTPFAVVLAQCMCAWMLLDSAARCENFPLRAFGGTFGLLILAQAIHGYRSIFKP